MENRNKKIGLWLLFGPIIGLVAIFVLYAIASFIFASMGVASEASQGDSASLAVIIKSIISIILGLSGILCVIGILIGIPLGIIYIFKKDNVTENTPYDERSGKGKSSVIPDEIKGWNWGALGLPWIWGIYYSVWISLLALIPVFNLIWIFVLAVKGNEWSWRNRKWQNVEQFKASQEKWKIWGIIFFALLCLNIIISLSNLVSK